MPDAVRRWWHSHSFSLAGPPASGPCPAAGAQIHLSWAQRLTLIHTLHFYLCPRLGCTARPRLSRRGMKSTSEAIVSAACFPVRSVLCPAGSSRRALRARVLLLQFALHSPDCIPSNRFPFSPPVARLLQPAGGQGAGQAVHPHLHPSTFHLRRTARFASFQASLLPALSLASRQQDAGLVSNKGLPKKV